MTSHGPLRTMLICRDPDLRRQLREVLSELEELAEISADLPDYPSSLEFSRLLRAHSPQALFLSFERPELARKILQFLEAETRDTPVIGIHRECGTEMLRACMRLGVREFLTAPFRFEAALAALRSVASMIAEAPPAIGATDHIYSFLPAKPGVGATTLAMNAAVALMRRQEQPVLLADLDLNCGMLRFLLKLGGHCVLDAINHAPRMDEDLWQQLTAYWDGVDVLHSGSLDPQVEVDLTSLTALTNHARHRYGSVVFDLSGSLERHSIQVMQDSKRVLLVTTPEPAALVMAKEKLQYMSYWGLQSRVGVLLNRVDQQLGVPPERVENLLGVPILRTFSNHYNTVCKAIESGSCVPPKSALGREFAGLAKLLIEGNDPLPATPRWKPPERIFHSAGALPEAVR